MNNSAISPSPDPGHSPKATPFAVRLENRVNLLGLELSSIVKRVKGISKCLLADRAEVTLAPLASYTVFVGFLVTAK